MEKKDMKFNKGIVRGVGASLFSAALLVACAGGADKANEQDLLPEISKERIRNDMAFLADDALRGRDTDSVEYRIAANYMATQFANLGLKPAGDEGSFLQEVPFHKTTLVEGSASAASGSAMKQWSLKLARISTSAPARRRQKRPCPAILFSWDMD